MENPAFKTEDNNSMDKYTIEKHNDTTENYATFREKRHFLFRCIRFQNFTIISKCCAELIGSGMLVFFGCMGLLIWAGEANHMAMVLNFGFVIMIIIQLFAHVSGAHFNPSLTLSAAILKTISIKMSILYFFSQMIGGLLGFGLLKLLTPPEIFRPNDSLPGVCSHQIHALVTPTQAFFIEFLATGVLIFVCCSVWDPRNATRHDSVPIKFGFTIFVLAFTTGPYTGCGMNPARSFPPSVWNGDYDHHWIFWIAPLSGSAFVTILYKVLFWPND